MTPSTAPVRCLLAPHVFTGEGALVADGAVVVDDDGNVLDIGTQADVLPRATGAEIARFAGLLMPGLVNAHTHVELSHLRGQVPGGAGFFPWVMSLLKARAASMDEDAASAADAAADELARAGTVAVGDVSNGLGAVHALARKGIGGIVFHEVYGYDRHRATVRLCDLARERAEVVGAWPGTDLAYAPAPHTLYTTHPDVVRGAVRAARKEGVRSSIHLGEHPAEREFLEHGTGGVVRFAESIGASLEGFPVPRRSPVAFADELEILGPDVILVHLTTTTRQELDLVAERRAPVVLCPRSNLMIEVRLPPVADVLAAGILPALGTDSLASNSTLDVLAEAKAIAERYPTVPAATLLAMATAAGADALARPDLGRIAKGKRPGVLHVDAPPPAGVDPARHYVTRPPSTRSWAAPRLASSTARS